MVMKMSFKKAGVILAAGLLLFTFLFALEANVGAADDEQYDLRISSLTVNSSKPYDGDSVKLVAMVRNDSKVDCVGGITVVFSVDNVAFETVTYYGGVEAEGSKNIMTNKQYSAWFGSHSVKATVIGNDKATANNYLKARFIVIDDVNPNAPETTKAPEPTTIPYVQPDKIAGEPVVTWRMAPRKLSIDDNIVMGLSIADYGVTGDGVTDVTAIFQKALDKLGETDAKGVIKGGTLYVPAGKYVIKGTLKIPKGVTLCGDFKAPTAKNQTVEGTVLMAYSGKGDSALSKAFITILPNAAVRDLTIWYPEQLAESPSVYPPTISLNDEPVWGEDGTTVKNVNLVNSYTGIYQEGGACLNTINIYGTPLKLGLRMDGIHDIARWQNIHFGPEYWANSKLTDAPKLTNTTYTEYLKQNATAISVARIDWSYLSFVKVNGYNIGLLMKESESSPGSFPNGQCYDMEFENCNTAIKVIGGAKEELTNLKISACNIGIEVTHDALSGTDSPLQVLNAFIDAREYAVKFGGDSSLVMQNSIIQKGKVYANNGNLNIMDCSFMATSDHIIMDKGSMEGIFTGNKFMGVPDIIDNGAYKIVTDNKVRSIEYQVNVPEILTSYAEYRVKPQLFDVAKYGATVNDNTDDSAAIQAACNAASNAGGGIVFLPPGHYTLNNTRVTVPANVEVLGSVDITRVPIQLGTIIDVVDSTGDQGTITGFKLSANSGLRGVVFSDPNPNYSTPVVHDYVIQGLGENIHIINVAFANVYQGIDLFTNKCDNHYVDGTAGFAIKTAIRVGGGSVNGRVYNSQFNCGPISVGYETKWGSWPNSIPQATKDADFATFMNWVYANSDTVIFGDCVDELVFNNFSIFGDRGLYLKDDNGKAPSGWFIGNGVDMSRRAFFVDGVGKDRGVSKGVSFVNTQLVSANNYGYTDACFITVNSNNTSSAPSGQMVNMFNTICWAVPKNNVTVGSDATLNLYNALFTTMGTDAFANVSSGGNLGMEISHVFNTSGSMAKANQGRISFSYNFFKNSFATDSYKTYFNNLILRSRWAVPTNFTLPIGQTLLFTESFDNYPASTQSGIANAFGQTDSFSEWQQASSNASVTLVQDGGQSLMRLLCGSRAVQSYAYNHSTNFESGKFNSQYVMEIRFKVASLRNDNAASCFYGLINSMTKDGERNGGERLFTFKPDGTADGMGTSLGSYSFNTYYRLKMDFDTRNISAKTVTMRLCDDSNTLLSTTGAKSLAAFNGKDDGIGHFIFNSFGGTDTGTAGQNDVQIDYVVVTQKI